MNCPKCGNEMTLRVNIGLVLPAKYVNAICKKVIKTKECKITHADWDNAAVTCYKCKYRERGV